MQNIIIFILIGVLFILVFKIRKERVVTDKFLREEYMSIFWALKEKGILTMKDVKDATKVSKGKKMPPLSLNEWGKTFDSNKDGKEDNI